MKRFLLFFLLFPTFLLAQDTLVIPKIPIDPETGLYSYTDIQEVPGVSKEQLFVKANEWIAVNYNSAKNVIQMSDKEAGKIIIKAVTTRTIEFTFIFKSAVGYTLNYMLNCTFKDGKYKIQLAGFSYGWEEAKKSTTETIEDMIPVIWKYNKKHKHKGKDEDDVFTPKAKTYLKYIEQLDKFATSQLNEFKTAMQKKSKDDF